MMVAVGIKQNFNGHAEEPGGFPRVCPTLHQPRCGRVS